MQRKPSRRKRRQPSSNPSSQLCSSPLSKPLPPLSTPSHPSHSSEVSVGRRLSLPLPKSSSSPPYSSDVNPSSESLPTLVSNGDHPTSDRTTRRLRRNRSRPRRSLGCPPRARGKVDRPSPLAHRASSLACLLHAAVDPLSRHLRLKKDRS